MCTISTGSLCLHYFLEKRVIMRKLLVLGFVGLLAQLVDGSLGMAYGVTSSTLLLAAGVAPAAAPAARELPARLVDGSLGMPYGVTSSTLLLAAGVAPAAASAAVHFSEIGT